MIKVDAKKFVTELKKFKLGSKHEIQNCLLQFNEDGMVANALTLDGAAQVSLKLNKEFFTEYESIGNIGIEFMGELCDVLAKFKDEISITKELDNRLLIKGKGKKSYYDLMAEEYIISNYQEMSIDYQESFILDIAKIKELFDVLDINGNAQVDITIKTEPGKIYLLNTGKHPFEFEIDDEKVKFSNKSDYGIVLKSCLEAVKSDIEVSLGTDYPLKMVESTEHTNLMFTIGPVTENKQ